MDDATAEALLRIGRSEAVTNQDQDPANLVDVIAGVADAVRITAESLCSEDSYSLAGALEEIAKAGENIAAAIRELAGVIQAYRMPGHVRQDREDAMNEAAIAAAVNELDAEEAAHRTETLP